MATVDLYEDGGGQLYLVAGSVGYADLECVDSTFRADATALACGDTGDWTVPQYPAEDLTTGSARLVAQAHVEPDGTCRLRGVEGATIGYAARRYLGPDLAAVAADAGYPID